MVDKPESPLTRWSRLKRARRTQVADRRTASNSPAEPDDANAPAPLPAKETHPSARELPADLPDPQSLDKDSDFTPFLKDGVPEALRRQALRVLWRSDPVLANLDGLNDYDEDYRRIGTAVEAIKTAYNAGRGYRDRPDVGEREAESSPDPNGSPPDTPAAEETGNAEGEFQETSPEESGEVPASEREESP